LNYIDFPLENGISLKDFKNFVKKVKDQDKDNLCIIISSVYEAYNWENREKELIEPINKILNRYNIVNRINLVNSTYSEYNTPQIESMKPIISIEFFALATYYRIKYLKVETNLKWNQNAKKALFMTGKPDRINRIGLLGHFVESELINKLDWSFFPFNYNPVYSENNKKELKKFSSINYKLFCKKYSRSAGDFSIIRKEDSNHYSGFPYNVRLFSDNLFSIVSETDFSPGHKVWLTEKTWKTIANRHPFIIAGDVGSLKKLKSYGFRTFEQYLKIQHYDEIADPVERIKSISINTRHFLKNYQKFSNEINDDVEYNYKRFESFCEKTLSRYDMFKDDQFLHNFFKYRLNDS